VEERHFNAPIVIYTGTPVKGGNVTNLGDTFGPFQLQRLLGEGGMAKVYLAIQRGAQGFEKSVALKVIDQRVTEDDRFVKALINEARLGGQLKHPNVVEIYGFDRVEGQYYLAMELVDGWTLDQLLKPNGKTSTPLPVTIALELLVEVCKGLAYVHGLADKHDTPMHLVHRDIKPANIIVSRAGEVKLLDFGIAKSDTSLYKTTNADVTKGTPVYMSPEQVRGESLDGRSDLFALGIILHELLSGEVLLAVGTLLEILNRVLQCEQPIVQNRFNVHSPAIQTILRKCVRANVGDRFASAQDMQTALKQARAELDGPTLVEWIKGMAPQDSHQPSPSPTPTPGPTRQQQTPKLASPAVQLAPVAAPEPTVHVTVPAPVQPSHRVWVGGLAIGVPVLVAIALIWPREPVELTASPQASHVASSTLPGLGVLPNLAVEPGPASTSPRATRQQPSPAPVETGTGTLVLNSRPWSRVDVDGQSVGVTPVHGFMVSAGKHTLVFHCGACLDQQVQTQTVTVTVANGETVSLTSVRF